MFSLDVWQEILDTIRRNKLRTALTALSVAWGIFMLVLLLGAGRGLQNNIEHEFADDAVNSIWFFGGVTSMPHQGLPIGREITFDNDDYDAIRRLPGIEHLTGRNELWGEGIVRYGDKASPFDVRASHPAHQYIENTIITSGRFLNQLDLDQRRKVAVIGQAVAEFLFADVDPLGEWIDVNGVNYRVVGVFKDEGGEGELRKVYLPLSTAQRAHGFGDTIHMLMLTVGDASMEESRELEKRVRQLLAKRHDFNPEDSRALRSRNNLEGFAEVSEVFLLIRLFVWIVGIGTIIAGVVGVSNIMLIAVKERTKEIGVRKAIGATPRSIVAMIVAESVFLTAASGYLGLVAGVGALELVRVLVPENDYIRDPQVDLGVAVSATVLLIVCGALAGYFPARRAARVNPVIALKDE